VRSRARAHFDFFSVAKIGLWKNLPRFGADATALTIRGAFVRAYTPTSLNGHFGVEKQLTDVIRYAKQQLQYYGSKNSL
jgi:hypothetical protein